MPIPSTLYPRPRIRLEEDKYDYEFKVLALPNARSYIADYESRGWHHIHTTASVKAGPHNPNRKATYTFARKKNYTEPTDDEIRAKLEVSANLRREHRKYLETHPIAPDVQIPQYLRDAITKNSPNVEYMDFSMSFKNRAYKENVENARKDGWFLIRVSDPFKFGSVFRKTFFFARLKEAT